MRLVRLAEAMNCHANEHHRPDQFETMKPNMFLGFGWNSGSTMFSVLYHVNTELHFIATAKAHLNTNKVCCFDCRMVQNK